MKNFLKDGITWGIELWPPQASTLAPKIDDLFIFILPVCIAFTAIVLFFILYFVHKYRKGSTAKRGGHLTKQQHIWIEIGWSVIPLILGLVMFFWSMFLIFCRLSGQLATIGLAIRRIAAGDRATPVVMKAVTRDLQEMVVAIETLRQTALVADATVNRAREAEQRRLESLHQALDFVQATREPARELEHGIARLCDGIDAAIALVTPPDASPSAGVGVAASPGPSHASRTR